MRRQSGLTRGEPPVSQPARNHALTTPERTSDTWRDFCQRVDSAGMRDREIVVGVTGASGGLLARRFVEVALASRGLRRLHLVFSDAGLEVARNEVHRKIASAEDWTARLKASRSALSRIALHSNRAIRASIASGSYPAPGLIVIPC